MSRRSKTIFLGPNFGTVLWVNMLFVAAGALLAGVVVAAPALRIEVCHFPPNDLDNFHTITVSEHALASHLAHGDLAGACNGRCSEICDDGDRCTVDDRGDCEQRGCPVIRDPVDCDDGRACTTDSCDSALGCQNTEAICSASDLCHVAICAEPEGICVETEVVCPAGEACDPATGNCEVSCTVGPAPENISLGLPAGEFHDCGDGMVFDSRSGLQWEQKNGNDGISNPVNLHDVDNHYAWSGRCTINKDFFCQPNSAAATTCIVQTGGAVGCGECGMGDGTCEVNPAAITTVWDWLNQVNAAGFGGYSDWRLPTSAGKLPPTGEPPELESIVDLGVPGCGSGSPCIDPIFGPTIVGIYWSASTKSSFPLNAWDVFFFNGGISDFGKVGHMWVRAVRPQQ